jgi:hypothetical protein
MESCYVGYYKRYVVNFKNRSKKPSRISDPCQHNTQLHVLLEIRLNYKNTTS